MTVASVRETANFTNNTNAVTPYTLGQVLSSYATQSYVTDAIAHAQIDPSQVDLHEYAKKTDLPTKLSQLTNDDNYVQTVGGFIPSNLLPSYVDDVIEKANYAALPIPGEAGKIYVTLDDNLTYRWSGSGYVEISKSLALGTTSSTAYRGDYGNIAYQHSQTQGNPHGTDLTDMGLTVSAAVLNYLTGLDGNIMTKLAAKVDKAGDTMTGFLTLHADPTQKMHAANKDYVDKEINGISVTVEQHVTQIADLEQGLNGLTSTVGVQAQTLVNVQNDVSGLNQTTNSHTEAISRIDQSVSGITSTVSSQSEQLTHLEASVNQLDVEYDTDALFIPCNPNGMPIESQTCEIAYTLKFRGNEVTPDSITITGTHVGITPGYDDRALTFDVDSSEIIEEDSNIYKVTFNYTSGNVPWSVTKPVIIAIIRNGEDGEAPASLQIISSNGLLFKDNTQTTVLTVTIYKGSNRITNRTELINSYGSSAYLQWKWKRITDQSYGIIPSSDPRLSNDGFTLTLDVSDIDTQVTFICELISNESIQFEIYGSTRQNGIPTPTNPVPILCKTGDITETIQGRSYTFSLGSIELGAVGEYVDRIFKQDSTWYLEKNTLRITLSGTEQWSTISLTTATSYAYFYSSRYDSRIIWNVYNGYCNRFLLFEGGENPVLTRGADISSDCFSLGGTSQRDGSKLRIAISKNNGATTTSGFKTWLQTNETQFLIPLEEPVITEITDSTLLNQLNSVGN